MKQDIKTKKVRKHAGTIKICNAITKYNVPRPTIVTWINSKKVARGPDGISIIEKDLVREIEKLVAKRETSFVKKYENASLDEQEKALKVRLKQIEVGIKEKTLIEMAVAKQIITDQIINAKKILESLPNTMTARTIETIPNTATYSGTLKKLFTEQIEQALLELEQASIRIDTVK